MQAGSRMAYSDSVAAIKAEWMEVRVSCRDVFSCTKQQASLKASAQQYTSGNPQHPGSYLDQCQGSMSGVSRCCPAASDQQRVSWRHQLLQHPLAFSWSLRVRRLRRPSCCSSVRSSSGTFSAGEAACCCGTMHALHAGCQTAAARGCETSHCS